jgi:hypothetical protein
MPTTLNISDEATTLAELWLHRLTAEANDDWAHDGVDSLPLLTPYELGKRLCEWGQSRELCRLPASISCRSVAEALGPLFMQERAKLEGEARRWIAKQTKWRRRGLGEGPKGEA